VILPDWQDALLEKVVAHATAFSGVKQVSAFGSSVAGETDAWSDLDVRIIVTPDAFGRMFPGTAWLAPVGTIWALNQWRDSGSATTRLVFGDGRRLDLRFESSGGHLPPGTMPEADSPLAGLEAEFRFVAVQAVVKLARNDLLIGAHLTLELERMTLVVAMLLRDRDLGTTVHRHGGLHNAVVGRIGGAGNSAGDWLRRIDQAATVFGDLARDLDPAWRADWQPLRVMIDRALRDH
jgi:hypothetical protein